MDFPVMASQALTHSIPSPALSHVSITEPDPTPDFTLSTAITHLVERLVPPLDALYPAAAVGLLTERLLADLEALFESSWNEHEPQRGTGFRSLICTKEHGLPPVMRGAAEATGVREKVWRQALNALKVGKEGESVQDEWEVWCDPGSVTWRWGTWGYDEEWRKTHSEQIHTLWQTGTIAAAQVPNVPHQPQAITPVRPSHAIPIRAPALFQIPPTPAAVSASTSGVMENQENGRLPLLLPAFMTAPRSASGHLSVRSTSSGSSDFAFGDQPSHPAYNPAFNPAVNHSFNPAVNPGFNPAVNPAFNPAYNPAAFNPAYPPAYQPLPRTSHRGSESTSSATSTNSDTNSTHAQLLTPVDRPGSAEPFSATSTHFAPTGISEGRKGMPTLTISRGRTPPSLDTPRDTITPGTASSVTPSAAPRGNARNSTPYDGGNVTILGGGVKLGAPSRSSSIASTNRIPSHGDRSPSVSIASRALKTAIGPNSNTSTHTPPGFTPTSPRKQRTRRRIMPQYLGYLGQPGVGGPITGVFSQYAGHPPVMYGPPGFPHAQPGYPAGPGQPSGYPGQPGNVVPWRHM